MIYFVTAIGTDSGKTVISAIITEMLKADYWKPVQAGHPRDTETVQALVSNAHSNFHQEGYLLNTPASPHTAARIDELEIDLSTLQTPDHKDDLVIEGAGGVLVPLNDEDVVIDMVPLFNAEIVLVSNLYLGNINHTLLTAAELKRRNYQVKGIIFNGPSNPESERIILKKTGYNLLLHVEQEETINPGIVKMYAEKLRSTWD